MDSLARKLQAVLALSAIGSALAEPSSSFGYGPDFNYSTVTGYFLQDEASTNPSTFDYTAVNFGLINRTYDQGCDGPGLTQWQKFEKQVEKLNYEAGPGAEYKVLFLGRHGEGYHNAAETYYGTPAWNCYWAEIDGNSTAVWSDAHLTAAGIAQAQVAHDFWAHEIQTQRIPVPSSYYVSPLSRCLATANITYAGLHLPRGSTPFVPTVKELLRESISIHTCDRRSSRAYIARSYPHYHIESGFAAEDPLWNGVTAETNAAQDVRSRRVLDELFAAPATGTWVSVTSHSGEIGSILRVLGHRAFSLNTGAIIPVLVRAARRPGVPPTSTPAWTASAHCTTPPVSSVSGGACVCPSSAAPVTTTLAGATPINTS